MFVARKEFISVVHDNTIFFLTGQGRKWTVAGSLSMEACAAGEVSVADLPAEIAGATHRLMVVADYWIDNAVIPFQSRKRGHIEPFLARKAKEQYPDQPEVGRYFDYMPTTTADGRPGLYFYYVKEPLFFQIMALFGAMQITPGQVTSCGYLWQYLCNRQIAEFMQGAKVLVQERKGLVALFIFVDGFFLFSRSVSLANADPDSAPDYGEVVYELTQSLYLVSQKAKQEVDRIYWLGLGDDAQRALHEQFGDKLEQLPDSLAGVSEQDDLQKIGPLAAILSLGLLPRDGFPWIADIVLRHASRWALFQKMGIATGAVAACVLAAVFVYLAVYPGRVAARVPGDLDTKIMDVEERLEAYRAALEKQGERRSVLPAEAILAAVGISLPPSFLVKKIDCMTVKGGTVTVEGWVRAPSAAVLQQTLLRLVREVRRRFPAASMFGLKDFEMNSEKGRQGDTRYAVRFAFHHS